MPSVDFLTIGDSDSPGPVRPIDSEEFGGSEEAAARSLPEGPTGYTLHPLPTRAHPQAESSGSRRPSIEGNPAPDEGEASMPGSLLPEFFQWMKESHTATQEQTRKQAEDQKAAEQRHQEALRAMEEN